MSCKIYKPMLHSYINNELSPLEKNEIERHLQECRECQNEEKEIRQLKLLISGLKPNKLQLDGIKENIMAAIRTTSKVSAAAFDLKVLSRLGASLIACGMLVLFLNFSTFGNNLEARSNRLDFGLQGIGQKITQPLAVISKGLQDVSSKIVDLNGITFRLEQRNKGGMKGEL